MPRPYDLLLLSRRGSGAAAGSVLSPTAADRQALRRGRMREPMLAITWELWTPYIALAIFVIAVSLLTTWLIVRFVRPRRRFKANLQALSKCGAFERARFVAHPGGFLTWGVCRKRIVWAGAYQGRRVEISWTKEQAGQFFEYHLEAENPVVFFLTGLFDGKDFGRKRLRLLGQDLLFYCEEKHEERIRTILENEALAEEILELQWGLIHRACAGFVIFGDPQTLDCWKGLAVRQKRLSVAESPPNLLVALPDRFAPDRIVKIFDRLLDIHQQLGRVHAAWE